MNSKKIVPVVLVSTSIVLFIVSIVLVSNVDYFKLSNSSNGKDNNSNQVKEEISDDETNVTDNKNNDVSDQEEKIENKKENDKQQEITNSDQINNSSSSDEKQEMNDDSQQITGNEVLDNNDNKEVENNTSDNNVEEVITNESDVIAYFSARESSINSSVDQDDRTFREKAKETFVTIVDFIFYDKEIKGYTFDELTTSAKLKIIEIALSIDNKIDEYFPDYKETIKDKYTSIKGKLAVKYLEFTSTLCEKVGADTCNQAKEDFNTMKESFGFTWEFIKELASSGSTKVKEFYESWRDSE